LGEDGQAALTGLPSRLVLPMRNLMMTEELIEFHERRTDGTFWKASPRGRAVLRAADQLSDLEDDELDQDDER
jgi:hypothetical protein